MEQVKKLAVGDDGVAIGSYEVLSSIKGLTNFNTKIQEVYNHKLFKDNNCAIFVTKDDEKCLVIRIKCLFVDCKRCKNMNKYNPSEWPAWRKKHEQVNATTIPADLCCSICSKGGDIHDDPEMIICDFCEKGFHIYCLSNKMTVDEIPEGKWYCDDCAPLIAGGITAATKLYVDEELNKMKAVVNSIDTDMNKKFNGLLSEINVLKSANADLALKIKKGKGVGNKRHMEVVAPAPPDYTKCITCKLTDAKCVQLTFCAMPYKKNKDPRDFPSNKIYKEVLMGQRICGHISCISRSCSPVIDNANRHVYCRICRSKREASNTGYCSECNQHMTAMTANHATNKAPFQRAINILPDVVMEIESAQFHPEFSPWTTSLPENTVECEVGEKGNIDTVVLITTTDGQKHLFMIEFQNTAREGVSVLTHKFAQSCRYFNPDRAYIFCVNLGGGIEPQYDLGQRIDIVRRWIILAIRHRNIMSVRNHWWFFWSNGGSPLIVGDTKSGFMDENKAVIKINYPPEGIKSDWEYATDMLAGHIEPQSNKKAAGDDGNAKEKVYPFSFIKKYQRPPTEVFGPTFPDNYSKYRVEEMKDMRCKEDCKACKEYYCTT